MSNKRLKLNTKKKLVHCTYNNIQCFRLITVLCYAPKRISWIENETMHKFEVRCDQRF